MGTGPLGLGVLPDLLPGREPTLFDAIRPRSKVTIVDQHGQTRTGRAVMYNRRMGVWILNMGGAHGTPGIASPDNVVGVR